MNEKFHFIDKFEITWHDQESEEVHYGSMGIWEDAVQDH